MDTERVNATAVGGKYRRQQKQNKGKGGGKKGNRHLNTCCPIQLFRRSWLMQPSLFYCTFYFRFYCWYEVIVFTTISQKLDVQTSPNFISILHVAAIQSFSGGVAIRHTSGFVWMTSRVFT